MVERMERVLREAEALGVDPALVFHENLQKLVLLAVYGDLGLRQLVLHGGTALRLLHGSPRFSLDLDFTGKAGRLELAELPEALLGRLWRYTELLETDVDLARTKLTEEKTKGRFLRFDLRFSHPELGALKVKVEIWEREPLKSEERLLLVEVPVRTAVYIPSRSLDGVLVDKVCSLSGRGYTAPRDVYDVWFVLARGAKLRKGELLAEFGRWKESLRGLRDKIKALESGLVRRKFLEEFTHEINRLLPAASRLSPRNAEQALRSTLAVLRRAEGWLR